MRYILSLVGLDASQHVRKDVTFDDVSLGAIGCLDITKKRDGDENVELLYSDDRVFFEQNIIRACGLLRADLLSKKNSMFMTIGIFGGSSYFSNSIVISNDTLRCFCELGLTFEINVYH